MEDNNILDCNKLIAEFMGIKIAVKHEMDMDLFSYRIERNGVHDTRIGLTAATTTKGKDLEELKKEAQYRLLERCKFQYHTSFDWLMPVVEKIESLGNPVYITTFSVSINRDKKTDIHVPHNLLGETKLEATYKAVVEFIKWYNKTKS